MTQEVIELPPYGIVLVVSHCTPSLFPALRHLRHKPLVCHFHGPRAYPVVSADHKR
jgi:hypothetical protein